MASGPPTSAAESSKMGEKREISSQNTPEIQNITTPAVYPRSSGRNPYAPLVTRENSSQSRQQIYSNLSSQTTWPMNSSYGGVSSAIPASSYFAQPTHSAHQTRYFPMPLPQYATSKSEPSTPSQGAQNHGTKMDVDKPLSPPSSNYKHWDEAIRQFLRDAGLTQALKGFECDMLVLNPDWEHNQIPLALEKLIQGLGNTPELRQEQEESASKTVQESIEAERDQSFDDRKLGYVHVMNSGKPRPPTSIRKEISAFLARNRARNDESNRAEFLLSLAEKRIRTQQNDGGNDSDGEIASCARTDAKTIDRELQMKYDIAKNDDGPLRRTKSKREETQTEATSRGKDPSVTDLLPDEQNALPKHRPGIDGRLSNIESHLAIRYVPSTPRTLWARLKFLEDHIVRLEKDYPPWAALHFNQPNRGWPPPPRTTPIIVPPHLRSSDVVETPANKTPDPLPGRDSLPSSSSNTAPSSAKVRNMKSSLQRAVLERLEVQKAMGEQTNAGL